MKEDTPILGNVQGYRHTIIEGYSSLPHATFEVGHDGTNIVTDYHVWPLSTMKVLTITSGSCLKEPVLWIEQGIITLIFLLCSMPTIFFFNERLATDRHGEDMSLRRWLLDQEANMRAFAMIMSGLCVFLLSFYTSMAVTRWWTIRTAGVGAMKAAATELQMCIYQLVTKDEEVSSAIRRYTRASLILVFLWRRGQLENFKDVLVGRGVLTEDECESLRAWNHNLHESIWAWQTLIVTTLYKEGKIHSDQLLALLLDRCSQGRGAMQLIHTYLSVKVPFQYVHLLGFLVKVHNTVLAAIMGLLFGAAANERKIIICFQLFGRTLILPFLFNAILIINAELADPFDGGLSDFPAEKYEKALEADCKAFISACENPPKWLKSRAEGANKEFEKLPDFENVEGIP